MWDKVQQTVKYIADNYSFKPDYGVILGSGLGNFADDLDVEFSIPYNELPNFPVTTVAGHGGRLIFGKVGAVNVVAMQGRFHYYEGYSMQQVTFPVRVMKLLGVQKLVVSNASGGVNPQYKVGDVVIIHDHINMMPEHPLRGANDERFGPRFVNMSEPYSRAMVVKAKEIAAAKNIEVKDGVYLGLQGPTFETLSEYRMVKILGADCVGMSTVPEVIVARHMDMECFGISVITDMGDTPASVAGISHEEVLLAARAAEPKVRELIKELIKAY